MGNAEYMGEYFVIVKDLTFLDLRFSHCLSDLLY